jgi:hypothetical protein
MSKKTAKKPTKKTSAPKSRRGLRPQHELTDEELSRASGGTVAWSAPGTIKLAPENPNLKVAESPTVNLDAGLWLLKK